MPRRFLAFLRRVLLFLSSVYRQEEKEGEERRRGQREREFRVSALITILIWFPLPLEMYLVFHLISKRGEEGEKGGVQLDKITLMNYSASFLLLEGGKEQGRRRGEKGN